MQRVTDAGRRGNDAGPTRFVVVSRQSPATGRMAGAVLRRSAMPFADSLEEHRIAGISLRNGLHERVTLITPAFANERCCALGRWIHDEGVRWDDAPELQQMKLAHASFHTIALVIAISITQGRLAEAAVMLEPNALFENAARMLAHAVSCFEIRRVPGAAPAPRSPIHQGCRDSSVATWFVLTETDVH
jgi:hypothetical protein